jgi:hypothetical protein
LDGVEITRTERIKAAHEYATIKVESVEEQDKESQNEVKYVPEYIFTQQSGD